MAAVELDYLVRRAEQEIARAQAAKTTGAAVAHYRLSEAYLERVAALSSSGEQQAP